MMGGSAAAADRCVFRLHILCVRASAKSIIMMAFSSQCDQQHQPMSAITLNRTVIMSASSAPTPAEGSVDRNLIGWM